MDHEITASDVLEWLWDNLREGDAVQWPPGEPDAEEASLLGDALAALRYSNPPTASRTARVAASDEGSER